MTKDQAVSLADAYVRARYDVVPPVGLTFHLAECKAWVLFYQTSWDTDEQGLPVSLTLLVDEIEKTVRRLTTPDTDNASSKDAEA